MKRIAWSMVMGALVFGTASASYGQDDKETKIHQRKENQQKRIGQGVTNGSLTAGETAKVEHQEKKINQEVRTERKANGGNLTNSEKRQVNRQQNKVSKEIYDEKHNAVKQSQ